MASRFAVKYLCDYMGVKALACRRHEAHGQTLVFADGRFYMVITGYNEPKHRSYSMYEISGEALEKVAEEVTAQSNKNIFSGYWPDRG